MIGIDDYNNYMEQKVRRRERVPNNGTPEKEEEKVQLSMKKMIYKMILNTAVKYSIQIVPEPLKVKAS